MALALCHRAGGGTSISGAISGGGECGAGAAFLDLEEMVKVRSGGAVGKAGEGGTPAESHWGQCWSGGTKGIFLSFYLRVFAAATLYHSVLA